MACLDGRSSSSLTSPRTRDTRIPALRISARPHRLWLAGLFVVAGPAPACSTNAGGPAPGQSHFTIRAEVPAATPAASSVFVAGNFNGWNPGDSAYRLERDAKGGYWIALPDSVRGNLEFKFTLGSWDAVETDKTGGDIRNRSAVVRSGPNADHVARIAAWRDPKKVRVIVHTARPGVSVVREDFEIPELGRKRRVWVYLPQGYESGLDRYPVLYMHDGQNIFDNATAFAGEWGIDETLDSLQAVRGKGVIVVAVDHGGDKRIDEYSPWKHAKYGGGEGAKYVDFLVKRLKPFIDSRYRTEPDRLNTGIAGSSMGGLISLYALVKYPDVFARAGIFSPALWIAPEAYSFVRAAAPLKPDVRIYFVSGALEASTGDDPGVYVRDQQRMVDTLIAAGLRKDANVVAFVRADGKHAEWFWRREFPAAYKWLFQR